MPKTNRMSYVRDDWGNPVPNMKWWLASGRVIENVGLSGETFLRAARPEDWEAREIAFTANHKQIRSQYK